MIWIGFKVSYLWLVAQNQSIYAIFFYFIAWVIVRLTIELIMCRIFN